MPSKFIYTVCILIFIAPLWGCKEKGKGIQAIAKTAKGIDYKKNTILLIGMGLNEPALVRDVQNRLLSFYKQPSKFITKPLPAFAYYVPRKRYKADSLLNYVSRFKGNHSFVIGLTSKDISTTKGAIPDYGIFGLGSLSNKGCVASIYRLKRKASYKLLSERLQKVVVHEVGHNHGLQHCTTSYPCVMKDAKGTMSSVDNEPMYMCAVCKKKAAL